MPVSRKYLCDDCNWEWTILHWDRNDPIPDCPYCETAKEVKNIPGGFNITGVKAKAVDYAQRMAEEDYGLTDMNDNLREGDIAAKAPKIAQTAEVEAAVQQLKDAVGPELTPEQAAAAKGFWGGGMASAFGAPPQAAGVVDQQMQAMVGMARQAGASDGIDPVGLLHKRAAELGKAGKPSNARRDMNLQVVGRAEG